MAAAHLTVAAAGSTTWELAFMAAPMLLVVVSDNQAANAKALRDTGSAIILDPASVWSATKISQILQQVLHNKELRKTMSQVASTFVDGLGASRVVEHIMPNFAALSETAEEGENDT
jgi:spore coat polysaccharide biosynthesis predicted glycosyltransferase SpsG